MYSEKKMKPILFNTEMVRAILKGRKAVTRRVMKPQPREHAALSAINLMPITAMADRVYLFEDGTVTSPPYRPGDILYVRETWSIQSASRFDATAKIMFKAGGVTEIKFHTREEYDAFYEKWVGDKWHPSIHMPREAARLFLRVTGVRAERLQNIIAGDCRTPVMINKEGLTLSCSYCPHFNGECKDYISQNSCKLLEDYISLWNSTIKPADRALYGWEANPYVWVVEFELIKSLYHSKNFIKPLDLLSSIKYNANCRNTESEVY